MGQICRFQNPDIPRAVRGGAACGGAAGRAGPGWARTLVGRFAQETTVPLAHKGIVGSCPGSIFGCTNKRIPIINWWGDKNVRLTSGLYIGPRALFVLAADQWTEACLSLESFFMQGMSGNSKSGTIVILGIPRAFFIDTRIFFMSGVGTRLQYECPGGRGFRPAISSGPRGEAGPVRYALHAPEKILDCFSRAESAVSLALPKQNINSY